MGLTDAELERVALLIEKMSEAIHILTKIIRNGFDATHKGRSNRDYLEEEMGHVCFALKLLEDCGDIDYYAVGWRVREKALYCSNYLKHQDPQLHRVLVKEFE